VSEAPNGAFQSTDALATPRHRRTTGAHPLRARLGLRRPPHLRDRHLPRRITGHVVHPVPAGIHERSRLPGGHLHRHAPGAGTALCRSGISATALLQFGDDLPVASQSCSTLPKLEYCTMYENGSCIRLSAEERPSGDASPSGSLQARDLLRELRLDVDDGDAVRSHSNLTGRNSTVHHEARELALRQTSRIHPEAHARPRRGCPALRLGGAPSGSTTAMMLCRRRPAIDVTASRSRGDFAFVTCTDFASAMSAT